MAYLGQTAVAAPLARVGSIDLKTTGQTTIYTVPAGMTLVVTSLLLRLTVANTIAAGPIVRAGKTSAYTEFVGATTLTGMTAVGHYVDLAKASALLVSQSFAAAEVLKLDVTTGATATTATAEVILFGYLF